MNYLRITLLFGLMASGAAVSASNEADKSKEQVNSTTNTATTSASSSSAESSSSKATDSTTSASSSSEASPSTGSTTSTATSSSSASSSSSSTTTTVNPNEDVTLLRTSKAKLFVQDCGKTAKDTVKAHPYISGGIAFGLGSAVVYKLKDNETIRNQAKKLRDLAKNNVTTSHVVGVTTGTVAAIAAHKLLVPKLEGKVEGWKKTVAMIAIDALALATGYVVGSKGTDVVKSTVVTKNDTAVNDAYAKLVKSLEGKKDLLDLLEKAAKANDYSTLLVDAFYKKLNDEQRLLLGCLISAASPK